MNQNIPHQVMSKIDQFFKTYDFYVLQPNYIPNDNIQFGNWNVVLVNNSSQDYTLECQYTYNNGKLNELVKCTVYIINGVLNSKNIDFKRIVAPQTSDNYY